jgi:multiple sugar transport system permease protein
MKTGLRLAAVLGALTVFLFPIYWIVTMAIKPQEEWSPTEGKVFWKPQSPTFDNFHSLFGGGSNNDISFLTATPVDATGPIISSLLTAVGGTLVAMLVGVAAAYGMARFRAGGALLPFQILQLRMFPPIAVIIPILFLWTYLHLFDSVAGLILIYGAVTFPFVVWLMRSFFQEIPPEIEEAAIVDGCSRLSAFRQCVLPLVRSGLATTALFVFILNWSDYLIALSLAGSNTITAPVFLTQISSAATGQQYGTQAALGLILAGPPVLISIVIQKHLVRGLTFGAVKR